MNVGQLKNVISEYISTENTTYGIMINGLWGIGKTHFIKEVLGDKHLYISLYGVKSTEDIDDRIFSQLVGVEDASEGAIAKAGKLISGAFKVMGEAESSSIGSIASTVGSVLKAKAIDNISPKKILIFDDLERTTLSPCEVLSKLNEFTEHRKNKVIIICDETKISKEEDKYWTNKEKTVLFTNTLERSSRELAEICFSGRLLEKKDLREQSIKELDRILGTIKASNLRILNLATSCYEKIVLRVDSMGHHLKGENERLIEILYSCVGYALAQRQYQVSPEILEQCSFDHQGVVTSYYLSKSDDENNADQEKSEWQLFFDEVDSKDNSSLQFRSVFNYICHGLLDNALITDDLKQLVPEEQSEIQIVIGFHTELGDVAYQSAVLSVLKHMKQNTLVIKYGGDLVKLSTSLLNQYEMMAFQYSSVGDLKVVIETYVNHALTNLDMSPASDDPFIGHGVTGVFSQNLLDNIIKETDRKQSESIKSSFQQNIINAISNKNQHGVYGFRGDAQLEPYIENSIISKILDELKKTHPEGVLNFARFMGDRYKPTNIFDFLSEEVGSFRVLRQGITEHMSTLDPSATKYCFNMLSRKLEEIISRHDKFLSVKKAEAEALEKAETDAQ